MFMFMFLRVQVEEEVLRKYENDLLQKEHSGCAALLRDDKVRRPFLQCSKCVNRAGQDRVWVWVCGLRCCRRSTAGVRHCCVMTR
jgi:hypothetical protein